MGEEEVEAEERMNSLENTGRKMKEKNRVAMAVIILIIINTMAQG